jgi:hypothetical protein
MRLQAGELAQREGLSLNHFISLAVAEKMVRMENSSRTSDSGLLGAPCDADWSYRTKQ